MTYNTGFLDTSHKAWRCLNGQTHLARRIVSVRMREHHIFWSFGSWPLVAVLLISSFHSWLVPSTSIKGCQLCVSCAPGMPHQDSVLLDAQAAPISRPREKKRPLPFLLGAGDKLWGARRNSRSQASIPGHSLENLEFWLPMAIKEPGLRSATFFSCRLA